MHVLGAAAAAGLQFEQEMVADDVVTKCCGIDNVEHKAWFQGANRMRKPHCWHQPHDCFAPSFKRG